MSTLWIWMPSTGIKVLENHHPADCDGARDMAAPALGANDADLCCHHAQIDTGTDAGEQDIYLVYTREQYQPLIEFLNTPAGSVHRDKLGNIELPAHPAPGM